MQTYKISRVLGWGSLLLMLWYLFRIHSELPANLAVHFDMSGRPNGWMSNSGFCWTMLGMSLIPNVFIRSLMRFKADSPLLSVPFKNYWLTSEERREILTAKLQGICLRIIAYMNCLWLFICYTIYNENSGPPSPPTSAVPGVIGILAATAWLLVLIFWDFRPRKDVQ